MTVTVYNQVNAIHSFCQISRTSACTFIVHTQMGQSNDIITAFCFQGVNLCLRTVKHFLSVQECQVFYTAGAGFCPCFRCIQTKNTNLHTICFHNGVRFKIRGICSFFQHVGINDGNIRRLQNCCCILQGFKTKVKFVVPQRYCVIICRCQIFRSLQTIAVVYQGGTLRKIPCIQQNHICPLCFIVILQSSNARNSNRFFSGCIIPVNIVGMDHNQFSVHICCKDGYRCPHYHCRRKHC